MNCFFFSNIISTILFVFSLVCACNNVAVRFWFDVKYKMLSNPNPGRKVVTQPYGKKWYHIKDISYLLLKASKSDKFDNLDTFKTALDSNLLLLLNDGWSLRVERVDIFYLLSPFQIYTLCNNMLRSCTGILRYSCFQAYYFKSNYKCPTNMIYTLNL